MNKLFAVLLLVLVGLACFATAEENERLLSRVKRGYGHGGGGGGGGGGGHGHGPGKGGGAAGPVYFCGYVGKTEGYGGGYGR